MTIARLTMTMSHDPRIDCYRSAPMPAMVRAKVAKLCDLPFPKNCYTKIIRNCFVRSMADDDDRDRGNSLADSHGISSAATR